MQNKVFQFLHGGVVEITAKAGQLFPCRPVVLVFKSDFIQSDHDTGARYPLGAMNIHRVLVFIPHAFQPLLDLFRGWNIFTVNRNIAEGDSVRWLDI